MKGALHEVKGETKYAVAPSVQFSTTQFRAETPLDHPPKYQKMMLVSQHLIVIVTLGGEGTGKHL